MCLITIMIHHDGPIVMPYWTNWRLLARNFTRRDEGLVLIKPEESGKVRAGASYVRILHVAMCSPNKGRPQFIAFCGNFIRETAGNRTLGSLTFRQIPVPYSWPSTWEAGAKIAIQDFQGLLDWFPTAGSQVNSLRRFCDPEVVKRDVNNNPPRVATRIASAIESATGLAKCWGKIHRLFSIYEYICG